ncbi:NAD(P)-dependent oxidoreductase [Streptomyces sp. CA-288835]|uniref:NAD(P)-dependent oxidoreductase n=1 Tax=Streptomyces sp. CA-288835 TaxID=3240069 RepID=UPI003D93A99B
MRVTVFGATGGIGRLVVQRLLDDGHTVTTLVRNPAKLGLTHPQLALITGQLSDQAAVRTAVAGADAVISALGPTLERSATGTPVTEGTKDIVAAMESEKATRYIGLATPSLTDPKDNPHWTSASSAC